MAHKVNLDALIPREDLEVSDKDTPAQQTATVQVTNLRPSEFFYNVLRKPDFQRETSDWSPDKILGFVESFLAGDLIPALILWQAGSQIFVIDGAHRLSALIAWVHDDYGDGSKSKSFFDSIIPDEQAMAADFTRRLIKRKIGSYEDHTFAVEHPTKAKPETVARAKRLAALGIQLQWVKGNAETAEASFFKINQQASPIDRTELRLLKSRKHPNALAARAIARAGTGHKYWSLFEGDRQMEIEKEAKSMNELLFSPTLTTPIKTLDLPVAGHGYSLQSLPLIFDFVNITNDVREAKNSINGTANGDLKQDLNGDTTLRFMKRCHAVLNRITGMHPSSLGLHPAIYFYSSQGRYQPTAFLAVVEMIRRFEKKDYFIQFTKVRRPFEDFLLRHRTFVGQLTIKHGSGLKGYIQLCELFVLVIEHFAIGLSDEKILSVLDAHPNFSFLQPAEVENDSTRADFDTEAKSTVFLRDALANPLRCSICDCLIHRNTMTIDHVIRKADGGVGNPKNGRLAHPFCNTTFKN